MKTAPYRVSERGKEMMNIISHHLSTPSRKVSQREAVEQALEEKMIQLGLPLPEKK